MLGYPAQLNLIERFKIVGDRVFEWMFLPSWKLSPKGSVPVSPGYEHVSGLTHDVSTAHLHEAFGNFLTDVHNLEWKERILFWGYLPNNKRRFQNGRQQV